MVKKIERSIKMDDNRNIETGIEFLTRKMDEERVTVPESLSEANVREMIAREKAKIDMAATKPFRAVAAGPITEAASEQAESPEAPAASAAPEPQDIRPGILQEVIAASKEAEAASAAWTAKRKKRSRIKATKENNNCNCNYSINHIYSNFNY